MTSVRALALAALMVALPGCAAPRATDCVPLRLETTRHTLAPNETVTVTVSASKCDDSTPAFVSCFAFPRLDVWGSAYVLGDGLTAVREDAYPCRAPDGPLVASIAWDGTLANATGGAPFRPPPGIYWLRANAGGLNVTTWLEVRA